jgi:fructose-1,6-bisphosphatase I
MEHSGLITFDQFIASEQNKFPQVQGNLSKLFRHLQLASKMVNSSVRAAGLADILGSAKNTNVQGEDQQKLDVIANNTFIRMIESSDTCAAILSEEVDEVYYCKTPKAKYIVAIDPLDGSSNIDVNASIGTIFSIYKRLDLDRDVNDDDIFQKGRNIVAGGYIIYGSSTMLVFSTGNGVNGFTLDNAIQEYCLSHPDMKMPSKEGIFSVNEGNISTFPENVKTYIAKCKGENGEKPKSARYIGSLIADFHRNMIKGGIFMYPSTDSAPNGKLRLLYECIPMAYVAEQAGGKAHTGESDVLDIVPEELHQRVPLYIGNTSMVDDLLGS